MRAITLLSLMASFFLINLFLTINTFSSYAQNEPEKVLEQGIYQFRHENYDEALELFKEASKAMPNSSLAAYYLGITYKRMENYIEARPHLEASVTLTPKIKGAIIELIDLLYRLDEIDAAKKWIEVAEEEGIRPAQAAFLKGLTLLRAGEYEEAISAFEKAKSLDSKLVASSDYQIALAYVKLGKFGEAKKSFERIITLDPHADISLYASRYAEAIEKKSERERPFHATAKFAFEADSNVILKPGDTALVADIADEDDTRQVWDLKTDYTLRLPDNPFSVKAEYGFRLYDQNKLERYDVISNTFGLQPSMALDNAAVTFPASYAHTIVNDTTYVTTVTAGNMNNLMLDENKMTQIGAVYKYKDYFTAPSSVEDRTGNELIGTSAAFWFFSGREGFVSARLSGNRDWTKGANWEYWGGKAGIGVLIPFFKKFKLNTQGEANLQFYDNTHTIFNEKRRDQVYALSTLLSYEIFKNAEVQFQYTYINSQSNISIYEYDRHIFSTAVQYKF